MKRNFATPAILPNLHHLFTCRCTLRSVKAHYLVPCVLRLFNGVLKVPMNLTNWVLVGSSSPNLVVQLHIRLKSEISVVFGFLKAAVDELPKEAVELTTGTLREADSLAPI